MTTPITTSIDVTDPAFAAVAEKTAQAAITADVTDPAFAAAVEKAAQDAIASATTTKDDMQEQGDIAADIEEQARSFYPS